MAKFTKKAAPGEPEVEGASEVEETEVAETENPTPEASAEPAAVEEVQPAPVVAEPVAPATEAPDEPEEEDEEEDEQPRPKLTHLIRSAINGHKAGGGDPWLTGEFEALSLKLHECQVGIRAVQDKTEGELAAWLSHFHDMI